MSEIVPAGTAPATSAFPPPAVGTIGVSNSIRRSGTDTYASTSSTVYPITEGDTLSFGGTYISGWANTEGRTVETAGNPTYYNVRIEYNDDGFVHLKYNESSPDGPAYDLIMVRANGTFVTYTRLPDVNIIPESHLQARLAACLGQAANGCNKSLELKVKEMEDVNRLIDGLNRDIQAKNAQLRGLADGTQKNNLLAEVEAAQNKVSAYQAGFSTGNIKVQTTTNTLSAARELLTNLVALFDKINDSILGNIR